MAKVALFVRLEAKPGKEKEVEYSRTQNEGLSSIE